jgi:hypothetical protein
MNDIALEKFVKNDAATSRPLSYIWQNRSVGGVISGVITALVGFLVAVTMPHGPAPAFEQFEPFQLIMTDTVLLGTYSNTKKGDENG